jgi:Immunity protein Imm5
MSQIASTVSEARRAIDQRGALSYRTRVELLRSFDEAAAITPLGWVRRAALAILCARKCAGYWTGSGSEIELPPVLDFAEGCLREGRMFAELQDVAENIHVEVDNVLCLAQSDFRASYAGFAAVAAARTVVRDEILEDSMEGELVVAVANWGSAFWASCALAGGAVWEDDMDTDDEARRRFWLWYLDTAVPSALTVRVNPLSK